MGTPVITRGYTPPKLVVKKGQVAVFVAVWNTEMSAARPLATVQTRQNRGFQVTLAECYQIRICTTGSVFPGAARAGVVKQRLAT